LLLRQLNEDNECIVSCASRASRSSWAAAACLGVVPCARNRVRHVTQVLGLRCGLDSMDQDGAQRSAACLSNRLAGDVAESAPRVGRPAKGTAEIPRLKREYVSASIVFDSSFDRMVSAAARRKKEAARI